jgi:hypothetical protein
MSTRDEELERIVHEASAKAPVPEFEQVWRRAKDRAGRGGFRRGALQWALGPMLAAVSIAVVIAAVRGVPVRETPVAPVAGGVQQDDRPLVAVADAGAGTNTARAEEGLYVAGTDFLLEMDIPAWN